MSTRLHRTRNESAVAMHECLTEMWHAVNGGGESIEKLSVNRFTIKHRVTTMPKEWISGMLTASRPPTIEESIEMRRFITRNTGANGNRAGCRRKTKQGVALTLFDAPEYDPRDVVFKHVPTKVDHFRDITKMMADTYERKNADYGDSFGKSIADFGIVAGVVRISDKFNRLKNLAMRPDAQRVNDESITDTLLDMANYCIMLKIEIENNKLKS